MFRGLIWVELFFMFMFAVIIAVPRNQIIRLLPVGFFGGFGQAILILGLLVPVLGWWRFNYTDFFSVAGIPLFIALAWLPVVIIYAYYLNRVKNREGLIAYITGFSLSTALYVHWLIRAGFLVFVNWNSLFTFLVAIILFSPVTYYVVKTENILGSLRELE